MTVEKLHDEVRPGKTVFDALRGEPIVERPQGQEVPCYETYDEGKLCAHPLVSIVMLAYNHEKYLARAVEGVIAQETDFAYELLLCEDCSTDKTREMCFAFQRRFPDKIKVLWYDVNVNKTGGNANRAIARCRGEFIAFCEGDDYWTNPAKLARQVALMRQYPSAGLCFGGTDYYSEAKGAFVRRFDASRVPAEYEPGGRIARRVILGAAVSRGLYAPARHMSTFFCRRDRLEEVRVRYPDICRSNWRFGDTCMLVALATVGDVCFLRDPVSVYRLNDTGVTHRSPAALMRDVHAFNVLAAVRLLGMRYGDALSFFGDKLVWAWFRYARQNPSVGYDAIRTSPDLLRLFSRLHCRGLLGVIKVGKFCGFRYACSRFLFIMCSSVRKHGMRNFYEREMR